MSSWGRPAPALGCLGHSCPSVQLVLQASGSLCLVPLFGVRCDAREKEDSMDWRGSLHPSACCVGRMQPLVWT